MLCATFGMRMLGTDPRVTDPLPGTAELFTPDRLEVKRKLNRTAIGQILAGHDCSEQQDGLIPARLIIVCAVGIAALEWVCQKRSSVVRKIS
jgi:hypothetical protein